MFRFSMMLAMIVLGTLVHAASAAHACNTQACAKEQDREAILAMAGEYRVSFQFMETVALQPGYVMHKPHVSEATEYVKVLEDTGDRIVLQHILVLSDPDEQTDQRVVKHWRQDWEYENRQLYAFEGERTWAPQTLSEDEARGTWTQRVFQVDDSPRYQSHGRWTHEGGVSAWQSEPTWRPMPRREWLERDDYDVLVAVNRQTLTPDGWVHEQDNIKLVLPDREGVERGHAEPVALAREVGLNRYVRIDDFDFSPGHAYWQETESFWADVRAAWEAWFATGEVIALHGRVDGQPMWRHFFALADEIRSAGQYDQREGRLAIKSLLNQFDRMQTASSVSHASPQP